MTDKLNPNQQPELSERDAELLSAYIDEMLPADEHRELEARLANDPFLRRELAAMRQTVLWMNTLPTLKAPRDFTISAEDAAPTPSKIIPMPKQNWWLAASAAAILIVVIGIAAILPSVSNQAPASDAAVEQVAIQSTNPAEARTDDVMAYDAVEESDGVADDSNFADESASGGMSADAPPASEITSDLDTETQSQAPIDINSRSVTPQSTPLPSGQGSGADAESLASTSTADIAQSQAQEALLTTTDITTDSEESADTAPNANVASVMNDSPDDEAIEEAEADDMQDADMAETMDTFALSPEAEAINIIREFLAAIQRFLEALQA